MKLSKQKTFIDRHFNLPWPLPGSEEPYPSDLDAFLKWLSIKQKIH